MKTAVQVTVVLSFVACVCFADDPAVVDLTAKPVKVAMFKNGVGLVSAQVELPEASGHYRVRPLPDATLGSFWISWPQTITLIDVRATQSETTRKVPAATVQELLEANIGNTVDLKIQDVWQRVTIRGLPKRSDEPFILPREEKIIPPPPPPNRGELLLIEDPMGVRGIPRDWVQEIRFDANKSGMELERPMLENVIEFTAESVKEAPSGHIPVILTYLAKGIAWSPSYVVDLSKEDKATFSAKSVIVNDLLPLENTDVELISGYPHIQFENVASTFSLASLQQILEAARAPKKTGRADIVSNVMTQVARFDIGDIAQTPSMPVAPVEGEGAEDLYFYELKGITLKKGERGYQPVFSGEVSYEHVYTWDIPNYIMPETPGSQPEGGDRQVVWHSIKLQNSTGKPWTTAPALTMKDGHILGQDTIYYTPDRASTELKITQAVAVDTEQTENETARERNAASFNRNSYDLVTVKGELAVTNYKDKPIALKITKTLIGEVQQADREPVITKLARGLRSINSQSQLVWTVEVKPGKDNALKWSYTFTVYVRS
ncbi:MAG TPA: hypothetical protein PLQ35_17055 [bacterium]|nr:hypothetical protein [bacterium]HQL63988.1 hypothetical protein [bacterium]